MHYDFVDYCWSHKIIPYSLPPHSTHLMQPLDVVCFQPLKHYHRKAIDNAIMHEATTFPVVEFLTVFKHIRDQAFKLETVKSSFRETGIVPLNAAKVVGPLREKSRQIDVPRRVINPAAEPPQTPSPLPSNPPSSPAFIEPRIEYTTPRKVHEIDALGTHIHGLLVQQNADPATLQAFEKFRKGALAGLHAGAHAEFQLHNIETAQAAREAQTKQGKKIVAHARGGPIYVQETRATIRTREK